MQILLTEVTGAIGRAVARSLLASGHDVVGIAEQPHRDLDSEVRFARAALDHPILRTLAADADVVVQLPPQGSMRPADVVRVSDVAARGGARLIFPSLSLLAPTPWEQAEDLVSTSWAPSLIVRIAPPLGRQADALISRTVATLLDTPVSGPIHVLHVDDLVRFLVAAVGTDNTGVVDLGTPDVTNVISARHVLSTVDPRPSTRRIRPWPRLAPALDLTALHDDWQFECGWSAVDAVADTARGLTGRKLGPEGAVAMPGRVPMPVQDVAEPAGAELLSAAPDGAEGEFDNRIDPRFPVFVAAAFGGAQAAPLTPMSMDVHLTGLRMAARTVSRLLDLRSAVGTEWDSRLIAAFGHRIYLGASVLAAAQPRLPHRAAAFAEQLRAAAGRLAAGPSNRASARLTSARIAAAARLFRRHVEAYGTAAQDEHLDDHSLSGLPEAALGARIRLLCNRIHEGWILSGLGVLFAEAAPTHVEAAKPAGTDEPGPVGRIHSELMSLANVMRAHPYVAELIGDGDLDAARTAAPMFAAAFDGVLARMGHHGPGDIDLASGVFADRPEAVLAAARRVTRVEHAGSTVTGAQASRELAYDTTLRFTHELRSTVRELARRLVAEERLAAPEDIFYLTTEEALVMPVDARLRIKRRIAERERLQAVRMPTVIDGAWAPLTDPDVAADGQLRGRGISGGTAEGTVRVVRSVADADVGPDEIAVLAAADIDCAILIGTPAAVVSDTGPGSTDPATVARYIGGMPFVVDVAGAASRLVTGMRVRVDGTSGTVSVLAAEDEPATLTR